MAASTSSFGSDSSSFTSAFIVTGSGDAKTSASMIDFRSLMGHSLKSRRALELCTLVDADSTEVGLLEHTDQLQTNHLEQREEGHDHAGAGLDILEQIFEAAGVGLGQ